MTQEKLARALVASLAVVLAMRTAPALAQASSSDLTALIDRAQIEDMLVDYYGHLGGAHLSETDGDPGSYYLEDGVLDVNGVVARGRKAIEDLYKSLAPTSPGRLGKFHMLLSNPMIVVRGATATADLIWTGVVSETPKATPRIVEQGREHDELIKRNGRWYLKYRAITSDGGLPAMFEKTYQDR